MTGTWVCADCGTEHRFEMTRGQHPARCEPCRRVRAKQMANARYVPVVKPFVSCSDCGEATIPTDFRPHGGGRQQKRCEACHRAKMQLKWRRKLMRQHGITMEIYDAMLTEQGGTCAVPGCERTDDGRGRSLHIDHDHACCPGEHSCGRCVRGLLCAAHNIGIGYFQNDAADLEAAASYLRSRRPQVSAA